MHIYLIRHLPTKWNIEGKLQGRRNISIDESKLEDFRERIIENQNLLKEIEPFDVILASSLIRTMQTASVYGYVPSTEPLLDELDFGSYEGKAKKELIGDFHDMWYDNPENIILGEPLISLQERILLFLNKYRKYERVLVFGHGSWIRALISIEKFGSMKEMNQITLDNNELIRITR
jgi:broad specificity phosphatase PhoE